MPIIPAGFAQINFRFTGAAAPQGAEVVLGLDVTGFATQDPVVVANAVADEWSPTVMTSVTTALVFAEAYCKFGPNDTGPSGSAFRNIPGTIAQGSAPPNVAALIRKTTSGGGRRNRGRMYLPGVSDAEIDSSGFLAPGMLNALQVDFNTFFTGLTADGFVPVVLHSAGISAVPAPTPILALDVQSQVATQRDRLR